MRTLPRFGAPPNRVSYSRERSSFPVLPRLLLDTHILIRWLIEAQKLSRTQLGALEKAARRGEPVAVSAISLLEIAILASGKRPALKLPLDEFLRDLQSNPVFRILPLTCEIALEVASLGALRDPADRAIVATARVERLRLVTSNRRIITSGLVQVIE
jgi:PIN domain nuclease of toxin-antitoxin system